MNLPRRKLLHLAAGFVALPMLPRPAGAQVYPSRPVRIVAAFAAGGGRDMTAPMMRQSPSASLGTTLTVAQRPASAGHTVPRAGRSEPPERPTPRPGNLPET